MIKKVKFYWCKSFKVWEISGRSIEDITKKADSLCEKYHAIHFEIL